LNKSNALLLTTFRALRATKHRHIYAARPKAAATGEEGLALHNRGACRRGVGRGGGREGGRFRRRKRSLTFHRSRAWGERE